MSEEIIWKELSLSTKDDGLLCMWGVGSCGCWELSPGIGLLMPLTCGESPRGYGTNSMWFFLRCSIGREPSCERQESDRNEELSSKERAGCRHFIRRANTTMIQRNQLCNESCNSSLTEHWKLQKGIFYYSEYYWKYVTQMIIPFEFLTCTLLGEPLMTHTVPDKTFLSSLRPRKSSALVLTSQQEETLHTVIWTQMVSACAALAHTGLKTMQFQYVSTWIWNIMNQMLETRTMALCGD